MQRDSKGLIEGVEYKYTVEGLIDWRAMIPKEFLVVNKQNFERRNQPIPETIEGLADKDLLILLGGIKYLASLRGFDSVAYQITCPSIDYVVIACQIFWMPSEETQNRPISFSSVGDAHIGNTNGFGQKFLASIAENRAFVRCVRNFLKINIVGQEEIAPGQPTETPIEQENDSANIDSILTNLMQSKKRTFEDIKKKLITENYPSAENFQSISDIPNIKKYDLITRLIKVK